MRKFGYARVSTKDQTCENQLLELDRIGVDRSRINTDMVSGSVKAEDRPGFKELLIKLEKGDELHVIKLDRLGRDSLDIQQTIKHLDGMGVKVITGDIGVVTGSAGKLVMTIFAALAEMEREKISERTTAGLKRAKSEGKKLGRPRNKNTFLNVQAHKAKGHTQAKTAEALGLSIITVKRNWHFEYSAAKNSKITKNQ